MSNQVKVSLKEVYIDGALRAYRVTVTRPYAEKPKRFTVRTNSIGDGLWVDGKQQWGTSQFTLHGVKDKAGKVRRLFTRIENL